MLRKKGKIFILFIFLTLLCPIFGIVSAQDGSSTSIADYRVSYSKEGDTLVITNSRDLASVDVTAIKIWDDEINQDGIRPSSVKFQLYADDEPIGDAVDVVEEDNPNRWTYTWENLSKNSKNGKNVRYTVQEVSIPEGYTASNSEDGLSITNTHAPEMTDMVINWSWEDDNDRDGIRPDNITFDVYVGGNVIGTVSFNKEDSSTNTISVPVFTPRRQGVPAQYSLTPQNMSDNYELETDTSSGQTTPYLKGIHESERINVKVVADWNDNNDQDGKRPDTVTWQLQKDGSSEGDPVVVSANDSSHEWSNLYKYHDGGQEYHYAVIDTSLPDDYNSVSSHTKDDDGNFDYIITNNHNIEMTSFTASISWDDDNNRDGKRPESLTIQVVADGVPTDITAEIDPSSNWSNVFNGLPKFKDGKEIEYSFDVIRDIDDYTSQKTSINDILYKHDAELVPFTAIIEWEDNNNQDGVRPGAIAVQLYTNDMPLGDPLVVTSALDSNATGSVRMLRTSKRLDIYNIPDNADWKAEWTGLYKYENGSEISYTARLADSLAPDYIEDYSDFENATVIRMMHDIETVSVPYIVTWNDENDQDGLRPGSIDLAIYEGENKVKNQNVSALENEITGSFDDMIAKRDGINIEYMIKPVTPPVGYTVETKVEENGVIHLTFTFEPNSLVVKGITVENGQNLSVARCVSKEVLTIKLYVRNYGQQTLTNVTVRDYLPNGATFEDGSLDLTGFDELSGDATSLGNGFINVNIGQLKPGGAREITYRASAQNPAVFGNLPAYFDYGNETPRPLSAERPTRESNIVAPCKWDEEIGGNDDGGNNSGSGSTNNAKPTELPKTGFAPGVFTRLPQMSVNYQAYSQLRVQIPKLGVDAEILGVPYDNGNWDVTWLGENVGWLQNTAYPGSLKAGNSVLTGHLTNNFGQPGVFSDLRTLGYGDKITITAFGEKFTYIVKEIETVYHDTPQVLSQDTDVPTLTLITCRYYNEKTGEYDGRVVVSAVLDSIS